MMRRLPVFLAVLALSGCVINSNKHKRPRDLDDSWLVNKPRLLGVQAEPAEARPGDVVQFQALLVDPFDEIDTILWIACPVEEGDSGVGFGCISAEDNIIGVEPFQPPVYQAPADFLAEVPEEDRAEGRYVNVQVTGLPPIDPEELEQGFDFEDIDFNQVEAGYKRMIVSEASTPNHNPGIDAIGAEGIRYEETEVMEVEAGATYDLELFLTEELIETYEFVNSDGIVEQRVEEPYVAWYVTGGVLAEPYTLYPFTQAQWTAPQDAGTEGTAWAVVRDRRGGQAWRSLNFITR